MGFNTVYIAGGSVDSNVVMPEHIFGTKAIPYIKGFRLPAPAFVGPAEFTYTLGADMDLHWLNVACSGYSDQDNWSLQVEDAQGVVEKVLCDNIYTKEQGEEKSVAVVPIVAGKVLRFVFNNTSGTSKIVYVDFGFKR